MINKLILSIQQEYNLLRSFFNNLKIKYRYQITSTTKLDHKTLIDIVYC